MYSHNSNNSSNNNSNSSSQGHQHLPHHHHHRGILQFPASSSSSPTDPTSSSSESKHISAPDATANTDNNGAALIPLEVHHHHHPLSTTVDTRTSSSNPLNAVAAGTSTATAASSSPLTGSVVPPSAPENDDDQLDQSDLDAFAANIASIAAEIDVNGSTEMDHLRHHIHHSHQTQQHLDHSKEDSAVDQADEVMVNEDQYIHNLADPTSQHSNLERFESSQHFADPTNITISQQSNSARINTLGSDLEQSTHTLMQMAQSTLSRHQQEFSSELDAEQEDEDEDEDEDLDGTDGMLGAGSVNHDQDEQQVYVNTNNNSENKGGLSSKYRLNSSSALPQYQRPASPSPSPSSSSQAPAQPSQEAADQGQDLRFSSSSSSGYNSRKPKDPKFQKECQFCGHVFTHPGSLGRHLDLKRGTRLHPAEQIDLIRSDVKRRGDIVEIKARRAKRAREYNSREDVRQRARARRKIKDRVHKSQEQARQNFIERIGMPSLPPHPSFAYVVLYFLPPALWPHDPPTSQTLGQLKQALEPLKSAHSDNNKIFEEYTNKMNVAFEQWRLMNKESKMEIWAREQRRVAEVALGSLSLYDLGSRDLWLDMEEQRISKLEEEEHQEAAEFEEQRQHQKHLISIDSAQHVLTSNGGGSNRDRRMTNNGTTDSASPSPIDDDEVVIQLSGGADMVSIVAP